MKVQVLPVGNTCVVCEAKLQRGVAVIRNHEEGRWATPQEVDAIAARGECTGAFSIYYAGTDCFKRHNLAAYAAP